MLKLNFLKRKKEGVNKESRIEFFKKKIREKAKKKEKVQQRKHKMGFYIERAGIDLNIRKLSKTIFNLCVLINLVISFYLIYFFSTSLGITLNTLIIAIISIWALVFIIILFVLWVLFYVIIDVKIFKRKLTIEDVLPDFLQLTASNIKAGMTVDRALWYAVRPRFGVLAKEIEVVAKDTIGGEDLKNALKKFASKYDSILLKRAISLLIEGLEAGGEIGDLLNKIALNIQEIKTMRKEMGANVAAYAIFISFSTVVAAPFLFGLAGVLIKVIKSIGDSIGGATSGGGSFPLSFTGTGVTYTDFKIFAIFSLVVTSFFSASIIATIKKGDIKSGVKYIPIFMFISVALFLIADVVLNKFTGIFF
jgi:pilus assembly protein TadC|tara:strand:+ start:13 stop:1104 length:1092 start_codon:yes stop_codon:yes gene_type:complete